MTPSSMPARTPYSVMLANLGPISVYRAAAAAAVEAGISRVWMAETNGPDALVVAALLASEFTLEVGTAIVAVSTRTPAALAIAVADIAELSAGRPVHLGIGAGGQVIVERWHGVPFGGSVERVRDTIAVLRQAFAAQRTDHSGVQRSSVGLRLATPPAPSQVVIYIGGMGPKMVQLATEVADGLILTWLSPAVVAARLTELRAAEATLGRAPGSVRLVTRVYATVAEDVEAVRHGVRLELVEYVVSPPYAAFFRSVGYGAEVDAVTAAFSAGDRQGSSEAVSARMLDDLLVVGDVETVRAGLRRYVEAGSDDVLVQPVPVRRGGDPLATIAALKDL